VAFAVRTAHSAHAAKAAVRFTVIGPLQVA
jgi:hypothetical protein